MASEVYKKKVVIVGMGNVGSAFAYALMNKHLVTDIVLVDIDAQKAEGEAMDLRHGLPLVGPLNIEAGGYEHCADADIVVVTAGAAQKPGQTRLDLLKTNVRITKDIVGAVMKYADAPLIVMTTNPVDILTLVALEVSGLPEGRVIGSGTVLDSSRFRMALAQACDVDPRGVHAQVLGEHGDSEVPIWSRANVSGIPLSDFGPMRGVAVDQAFMERVGTEVRRAAYEIIERKGSTAYAIGLALCRIVEAVFKNQRSVLTVSTLAEGHYGLPHVCLSLPCVVGANGVQTVVEYALAPEELEALRRSAKVLRESYARLA